MLIMNRGGSMGGARGGSPPPETQKKRRGEKKEEKEEEKGKEDKGKRARKRKKKRDFNFFCLFRILIVYMGGSICGGTIISCTPWEHDEGLIFFVHFPFLFPERIQWGPRARSYFLSHPRKGLGGICGSNFQV
jgi:hypothetical protein